jgi:NitT/TauT family transport system substrate-binding protein
MTRGTRLLALLWAVVAIFAMAAVACGDDDSTKTVAAPTTAASAAPSTAGTAAAETPLPVETGTLRLGYFANITHAVPLVGVANGDYAKELGPNVKLDTKIFNAGNDAVTALFAGAIDAAYMGPNPAINGFIKSGTLRIVAGAASAGALLVVKPDINSAKDLANKKLATPGLGNTQDVALRSYLKSNGLETKENGGNVTILPTANADALTAFKRGDIQGAWEPEPWATRLVQEGGGKVLVDERTLWPNGDFVTTQLVVNADYVAKYPGIVEALVRVDVKEALAINADPEKAKTVANQAIKDLSGQALDAAVIDAAWKNLKFTYDPITSSLQKSADDAFALGFLGTSKPNLKGIYDLGPLNKVLRQLKLTEIKSP